MQTKDQLIAALRDPATIGARGTILYDLLQLHSECAAELFPELIALVIGGNYEEVHHASDLLDKIDANIALVVLEKAIEDMSEAYSQAIRAKNFWRAEFLDHCLSAVEDAITDIEPVGSTPENL